MFKGYVIHIPGGKRYGFIQSEDSDEKYFFHFNNLKCREIEVRKGVYVLFRVVSVEGRPQATDVALDIERGENEAFLEMLARPSAPRTVYDGDVLDLTIEQRKKALIEISNWKLEAKLEDINRYFFDIPAIEPLISGEKCYVVGRKGTGKTALVEKISSLAGVKYRVGKLSFKGFPFNDLYGQDNKSYTRPNQYISIWKLLIYSTACKLLAQGESVPASVRAKIKKALPSDDSDDLGTITGKWIAGDFGMSILGVGFDFSNWFRSKKSYSIHEKVLNLENFLFKNIGSNRIMILFDELDEDYKNMFENYIRSEYIDLITSLFKAVQDIKAVSGRRGAQVFPIIFIRDDIYDLIQDPDKNKWRDLQIQLDWNEEDIRGLLAHRLSKVINPNVKDLDTLWYTVFSRYHIRYSDGSKEISSFGYMKMSTMGRPRDYINYLRECAEIELRKCAYASSPEYVVSTESVRDADKAYSNYLKRELVDEIGGLLPDIQKIMSIFSETRKSVLHINEFASAYEERVRSGGVSARDVDTILRTLFYFSVIGNFLRMGVQVFKHSRPDAQLNFKERIVVHRGLMKALQII